MSDCGYCDGKKVVDDHKSKRSFAKYKRISNTKKACPLCNYKSCSVCFGLDSNCDCKSGVNCATCRDSKTLFKNVLDKDRKKTVITMNCSCVCDTCDGFGYVGDGTTTTKCETCNTTNIKCMIV